MQTTRITAVAGSRRATGAGRLATAAVWVFGVSCLPYLVLMVAWTLEVPLGIDDRSVLDSSGWMAGNALMAVVQLVGLLLVLALASCPGDAVCPLGCCCSRRGAGSGCSSRSWSALC